MTSSHTGRFAPSPTGPLHCGSLVAAVASFLEAKIRAGRWLVRLEDLDPPRTARGAADDILHTLEACGMHGDGAVLRQSTRATVYRAAFEQLRARGLVYPCACSRREIADSAVSGIEGPVYPGTCRDGLAPGKTPRAWRIDTRGAHIRFDDAIQGPVEQNLETDIGDFVLLRADQVYAYQLAVVIDDAEQGITDIVRGADLLDSTPRQIYLQRLLNLPTPRYAHLPVVVNARGEKLSKQTLAAPIDAAQPLTALLAALRFLGQRPPDALANASISEFWDWAIENWRLADVPRCRTAVLKED
jgi:glutamyl-Q tRNA(Asp) synthetase